MSQNKPKIVVYTAIINNYDSLIENQPKFSNIDYVCFTDDVSLKSNIWDINVIERIYDDPILDARMYKIKGHEFIDTNYDYSIWIDGNFQIVSDPTELFSKMETGLMTFDHSKNVWDPRNCLYDEYTALVKLKKDNIDVMKTQIDGYHNEGYPKKNGLVSTGVLIRKHNDSDVINFMNKWFDEIENHSIRDQLSFNYISWKLGFKFDTLKFDIRNNKYFKMKSSHKK